MLSSWKEIAHFFGKGVRTVQRWEKTLDLPVRRPPGAPSNVVLARTSDLEEWMHRSNSLREKSGDRPDDLSAAILELDVEVSRLMHGVADAPNSEGAETVADPASRVRSITRKVRGLRESEAGGGLKKVA